MSEESKYHMLNEANCSTTLGKARRRGRSRLCNKEVTKHEKLSGDYVKRMNTYVNWKIES